MAKKPARPQKNEDAHQPDMDVRQHKIPIKLTGEEIEAIVKHCTEMTPALREKFQRGGAETREVAFNEDELDDLYSEVVEAVAFADVPGMQALTAVARKLGVVFADLDIRDSLLQTVSDLLESKSTDQIKDPGAIYQFKISLLDIKPPVWRRIQVPDVTLGVLHEYIQSALGWVNCHLHEFQIDGEHYGIPDPDGFVDFTDENSVHLSDLIPKASKKKTRWIYIYDHGDDWRHEILFEGEVPKVPDQKYPVCIKGKRACPPENCGGPWRYAEYLDAIAAPKHEGHAELVKWGGPFDPEKFDPDESTAAMRGEG